MLEITEKSNKNLDSIKEKVSYYAKNKEKMKAYNKKYYKEHKEERLEYSKTYRQKHRKQHRLYSRKWRLKHPYSDSDRQYHKKYNNKYYNENKQKEKVRKHIWYVNKQRKMGKICEY